MSEAAQPLFRQRTQVPQRQAPWGRWMPGASGALAGLLLVAGCASPPPPRSLVIIPSVPVTALSPVQAEQQAHAVPAVASSPASSPAASATPAPPVGIALSPLHLPEHWQRRQVLHLRNDAELIAWPDAVWAERVETGMTRRLSQALRQRAPELGWWTGDDALSPRRLLVEVQQLDVHAARGEVVATLNWRLIDRQGRVLDGGSLADRLQAPIGDAQQEAEALAKWLDVQAEALASRLKGQLPR